MVKLELELTDIDYAYLIRTYLPKVRDRLQESGGPLAGLLRAGGMAETLLLRAPEEMKDKLAAELLNMNAPALEQQLEQLARENGIPGRVRGLHASAK